MVKVQRTRSVVPASRATQDICGLLLFFLGAACLLCLSLKAPAALLPGPIDHGLRILAGTPGAYAIPFLLMFAGTMFLIGYERLSVSNSSFGTLILFLIFVTWKHLFGVPVGSGHQWEQSSIENAGGWIGAFFGSVLRILVGDAIAHLLLVTLAVVAILLLVDQPFIVIMRSLQEHGRALAAGARERAQEVATLREAAAPRKALAGGEAQMGERTARKAKSIDKALASGANAAEERNLEEEASPGRSLLDMFHLTRPWRDKGEETPDSAFPVTPPPDATVKPGPATGKLKSDPPVEPGREKRSSSTPTELALDPAGREDAASSGTLILPPEFVLPPLTLLNEAPPSISRRSQEELTSRVKIIEKTLEQFNIGANVVEVASGPTVTRYEIQLAPGIKVSKIVNLADNLAMSLAAIDVRVEAPIPGKSAIGVEVPNTTPMMVTLRECLETDEYRNAPSKLTFALGKDVSGQYKYADLTKMPHLLIGGSTNSGKSVCLNVLIASLLYRASPRELKLLMIDPKRVELSLWDGIPHLMHPVVKDVKQASGIFRAALKEMDRRYDMFAALGTRNLEGFNQRVPESEKLPYLVLIVDELADLMMQQGPEIESSICRLAQLARATGIHLVLATQRPSVDIITGTIKANISSRIAFAVASQVDSRTILDMTGADRLIGRGDMLFMPIDASKPLRIQGCYLSEGETNALVNYLKEQEKPVFNFSVSEGNVESMGGGLGGGDDELDDQFFEQAVRLVANNGQASTSMLQRRFRIGYTRAARIVEMMEEKGIVGPLNGAKPREILVSKDEVERMFNPGGAIPSIQGYSEDEELA